MMARGWGGRVTPPPALTPTVPASTLLSCTGWSCLSFCNCVRGVLRCKEEVTAGIEVVALITVELMGTPRDVWIEVLVFSSVFPTSVYDSKLTLLAASVVQLAGEHTAHCQTDSQGRYSDLLS